jgi:predicted alpha/beta superfamily hydrolase
VGFAEYHPPPGDTLPPSVQSLAAPQYLAGRDAEIRARVVAVTPPDSATLFVRPRAGGFYRGVAMRRAGSYEYAATVPAAVLREGPHEFVITVFRGDAPITFPEGLPSLPWAWNYHGRASWKLDVVAPRSPLRLFDPGADAGRLAFTRIGDAGRRGLFRVAFSEVTGSPVFHLELPVDSSGWGPDDYTASLVIDDRVRARGETLGAAEALDLRLRGLGPRQVLHVTLMEDDGTSWTAAVPVDSAWTDRVVPLSAFTAGRGVLLPQGFPGQWSYWVGPADGRGVAGDRPRPDRLERLQLSLRREQGVTPAPGRYGIEVESVVLRFGARPALGSSGACCEATIRARVPDGTGTVYLAGSLPDLGPWRPDGRAMAGEGRERSVRITAPPGTAFEYKFTLGSWDREALGPTGTVPPNQRLVFASDTQVIHEIADFKKDPREYIADWRGSGVRGRLVYWTDVASAHLGPKRHVEIWLPPGYDESPTTRYPVLYMHDGQNLFDPRIANTGIDWGVDEAVVRLAEQGTIPPVIVVGVWSTAERGPEYSPWHGAPAYARFLIEELMPRVNREFRTLADPANTAVMGSSMGGLLSFYLVTHHPEHFGACGCVSTHFPFSEKAVADYLRDPARTTVPDTVPYIVRDIERGLRPPPGARYWFDYGGQGLDAGYGPTHDAVRAWLRGQGLVEGRDFVVRRYAEATHNEASWRARLDDPLTFLFGRRPR